MPQERKRVKGIEPSPPAWKAGALPLSYTRKSFRQNALYSIQCRKNKWGRQDSNLRRLSHQIYSLTPLATRVHPLNLTPEQVTQVAC